MEKVKTYAMKCSNIQGQIISNDKKGLDDKQGSDD